MNNAPGKGRREPRKSLEERLNLFIILCALGCSRTDEISPQNLEMYYLIISLQDMKEKDVGNHQKLSCTVNIL